METAARHAASLSPPADSLVEKETANTTAREEMGLCRRPLWSQKSLVGFWFSFWVGFWGSFVCLGFLFVCLFFNHRASNTTLYVLLKATDSVFLRN